MDWKPRASPNPANGTGNIAIGRGLAYVYYKHVDNRIGLGIGHSLHRGEELGLAQPLLDPAVVVRGAVFWKMAPRAGLEPATWWLTATRSTD